MTTSRSKRPAVDVGPSKESLREMPELSPDARKFKGRGPEAMANAQAFFAVVRGRPRKGAEAAGSTARSLRLPDSAWAELERRAAELEMPLHKLLRRIVGEFLYMDSPRAKPGTKTVASKRRPRRSAARRRRAR